jgi:molybdopterin-binding protein
VPARLIPIGEAASRLDVSLDTVRRWERSGKLHPVRGSNGRRLLPETEVNAMVRRRRAPAKPAASSARNRLPGVVTELTVEGLLAQVVLNVDGHEVVAIITRDSARALGLRKGSPAAAVIKSSHVIIERLEP